MHDVFQDALMSAKRNHVSDLRILLNTNLSNMVERTVINVEGSLQGCSAE